MKHLLNGVAIAAVLAVAAPVWAQNPSGGNALGTPGPNPGGPGLTPYSTGSAPPPPAAMPAPMPGAAEAPPPAEANSATPPGHHHRMYHHAKVMRNFHREMARKAGLSGDTTAQLNREELARIQSGGAGAAPPPPPMGGEPPPPPPASSGGNSMGMPGPNTGGPGLTPYTSGAPQR
jgi:hypothetical protein